MNRRHFLKAAPAVAATAALGWDSAGQRRTLFERTPATEPSLVGSHLGFRLDSTKRILVRNPSQHAVLTLTGPAGPMARLPVAASSFCALDGCATKIVLQDVRVEGRYRASLLSEGNEAVTWFEFTVARDAWWRFLPILADYAYHQRCGQGDRVIHPVCHLDDGRRRDTGAHVDVTGGWHDAGDLRKWVDAIIMNLFGLTALARNLGTNPASGPLSVQSLLAEARFGNSFFLKMQDSDGLVWADVGGGVHGDNSDNHWTDNKTGTDDDRWINTEKRPRVQAMFVAGQAIMHQLFSKSDPTYASTCLSAALRCWRASSFPAISTIDLGWQILAAVELYSATRQPEFERALVSLSNQLAASQVRRPVGSRSTIRGFFPMWVGGSQPLRDAVHSAIPLIALLQTAKSVGNRHAAELRKWRNAVRLYLDEYAIPTAGFSSWGIVPFGIFLDTPAEHRNLESYRVLSDRYTCRFFMPVRTRAGYSGLTSHLLSHALLFASASVHFGETKYRDLAYSHLEWVFGANPFGASLVTGVGRNQPPAFSPFAGLIPGGIMNGICGNPEDQPVLDQENASEWRTNEYWSPHAGYCQWTLSLLEGSNG
jgi:hypothetical protein